jgi:hypothetical protein
MTHRKAGQLERGLIENQSSVKALLLREAVGLTLACFGKETTTSYQSTFTTAKQLASAGWTHPNNHSLLAL